MPAGAPPRPTPPPRRRAISSAIASISICWDRSTAGKTRHDFDLGAEEARVRAALELAAAGPQRGAGLLRRCRHLRHGQPGLRADRPRRRRRLGARRDRSARPASPRCRRRPPALGAPLGHDFCAISLSDLLTPWPVIEQRLARRRRRRFRRRPLQSGVAAPPHPAGRRPRHPAQGARRRHARRHRPQSRPRRRERLRITTLAALDPGRGRHAARSCWSAAARRAASRAPTAASGSTRRAATTAKIDEAAQVTVHFIGAGPGDPDLITVRGRDLIARCPVVLYAGSLVPRAVVAYAPKGAQVDRHRAADARRDHRPDRRRPTAPARTSRASIPAIPRSTAPSPSRCAGSMRSASPTT